MTHDDAGSAPMLGSQEPVAWWFKCDGYESVTLLREHADAMAEPYGTTPIPLYRSPTLTDEESVCVRAAIRLLEHSTVEAANLARVGLLRLYERASHG